MTTTTRPTAAPTPAQLLTVQDVAERLQLDPYTVRRHIGRGWLTAVKLGKTLRIDPADLDTYLSTRRTG